MTSLTISENFECSKNNLHFIELLGFLEGLLDTVIYIAQEEENINWALKIFSYSFNNLLPKSVNNLNSINYKKIFFGRYSTKFILLYSQMIEIWKETQDYLLACQLGEDEKQLRQNAAHLLTNLKKSKKLLRLFTDKFFSTV
jgi:hypothetical protein